MHLTTSVFCSRLAVFAPSLVRRALPATTAVPPPKLLGSTLPSAQVSLMSLKPGPSVRMEQLQEVFGCSGCPLTRDDTATVKREAKQEQPILDRSKAARTDQGKGRPGYLAPRSRQRGRKVEARDRGRTRNPFPTKRQPDDSPLLV